MILSPRRLAGCTLTFAAFALAALSGTVSFTGISALLPSIPGIGFLGFVIAVTTVARASLRTVLNIHSLPIWLWINHPTLLYYCHA